MRQDLKGSYLGLGLAALLASSAQAATITVVDGEVARSASNGNCSLLEAIDNAEAGNDTSGGDCVAGDPGNDTIVLPAGGTFTLTTTDVNDPNYFTSGLPEINSQISVLGNSSTITTSIATCSNPSPSIFRIAYIGLSGNLSLSQLTVSNGCGHSGGAFFNRGTLIMNECTIENNTALYSGGGIHNDGLLSVTDTSLSNNQVTFGAGGGVVNTGSANFVRSTIDGNSASGTGAGLLTTSVATNLQLLNVTVSGNSTPGGGGGLFAQSSATAIYSSFVNNRSGVPGGSPSSSVGAQVQNTNGVFTASHTLFSRGASIPTANHCSFFSTTALSNTLADGPGCGGSNLVPDILLMPLQDNGGHTLTHLPALNSPAVDAGSNADITLPGIDSIDQTGRVRPHFGSSSLTADIGAVERNGNADVQISVAVNTETAVIGEALIYTISVLNQGPSVATEVTVTLPLTAAFTLESTSTPQGSCSEVAGDLVCELGLMTVGQSLDIIANGRVAEASNFNAQASASTSSVDGDGANAQSPLLRLLAMAESIPALPPLALALLILTLGGLVMHRRRQAQG